MKKLSFAAALFACVALCMPAFGQTAGSATVTGTVTDSSGALIPGVTVRATAVDTGVVTNTVSNDAGVYNMPRLLPGNYTLSASLPGFQTKNLTGITLGQGTSYRFNFELTVSGVDTQVEVSISADTVLATSGATIGQVLTQQRVSELPMVGNNVLQLIGVLAGVENVTDATFGREATTFAGISAANITTVRDGIMVQDTRWPTGINSATVINPDLVGEIRLILAPVDAEVGRGNGTVQIQTRSGTNRYNGAAVWSFRNTALDPNSWANNRNQNPLPGEPTNPDGTPRATQRNWSNTHQVTLSYGGPIVRNKTFFYALYDQNDSRGRVSTNFTVLTPCARNGIFRYFPGWNSGNANQATNPGGFNPIRAVVDVAGNPITPTENPNNSPYTQSLQYFSVFGALPSNPSAADCSDVVNAGTLVPNGGGTIWDANRNDKDSTGYVDRNLALMPMPNNFEAGDGLNTAGFRWLRHTRGLDNLWGVGEATGLRKQINLKIDQNFNANHKANVNVSYERVESDDTVKAWPDTWSNANYRRPLVVTAAFTSTLSPSLLNEARFGIRRTGTNVVAPWDIDENKEAINAFLPPPVNGMPVIPRPEAAGLGVCNPITGGRPNQNAGSGNCFTFAITATYRDFSPVYTYADTVSWTKGAHAMRFGGELRTTSSRAETSGPGFFTDYKLFGQAIFGNAPGAGQATSGPNSLSSSTFTGLGGSDAGRARGLQNYLAGSLSAMAHIYTVPDASDLTSFADGRTLDFYTTKINQTEFSAFFKDDWKISRNLTLNLGGRWEYYGVPYVDGGLTLSLVDGGGAAFGISGRDMNGWMNPGARAGLTNLEFVGPGSPNPGRSVYNNDWNNFGPAVGFAWQLPWFGEGLTTVRGGYQVTFQTRGFSTIETALTAAPGKNYEARYTGDSSTPYLDLTMLANGFPAPIPAGVAPLQPIPITERNQDITTFDPNYVHPYVQNLTLSVTRSLRRNMTLDVRYVGTLARKQFGTIDLNTPNFLYNGLLQEFESIRTGGEAPMLDDVFAGINICATSCAGGRPYGPIGTTVDGVLQTAAYQLRSSSAGTGGFGASVNGDLANANYSRLASWLNTYNYVKTGSQNTTLPDVPSGVNGAALRLNGVVPENFIATNPQFGNVNYLTNYGYNNYHSVQTEFTLRPTQGFSGQATYSWSKNLGVSGDLTNPVARALDYTLTGNNRAHQLRTNGTIELPMGPNRLLFGNSTGFLARAIERWQLGLIYNLSSGAPMTVSAANMLYDNGVPDVVVPVDLNEIAGVRWGIPAGSQLEGRYFDNGDIFRKVPDPLCASVTSLQGLNGNNRCGLDALAMIVPAGTPGSFDYNGENVQVILQHPQPGMRGSLGRGTVIGPGQWRFDANLSKTFRIDESKSLQVRVDTLNVLNHPNPAFPNNNAALNINGGTPFGQFNNKTGGRSFQGQLRLTF